MRCRVLLLAVLFAFAGAGAAAPPAAPFSPPAPAANGVDVSIGAAARYAETFARLKAAWDGGKGPDAALMRLARHLERFDRLRELKPVLDGGTGKRSPRLRGLYGRVLVAEAQSMGGRGFGIVILNGRPIRRAPPRMLPDAAKKLLAAATPHLRAALRTTADDDRLRTALAHALEGTDPEGSAAEIRRLRVEAAAIADRRRGAAPAPLSDRRTEAVALAEGAADLERATPPKHDKAELVRKKALVLAYCSHTIPFDYEPALFGPVSLLAPRTMLDRYLTRRYAKSEDAIGEVPPHVFPADRKQRRQILRTLGLDASDAAAAALLASLRHSLDGGAHVAVIADALRRADYPGVRLHLPKLLDAALLRDGSGFPPIAQRVLVELAADLGVKEAAPALRRALPRDRDLHCPRGIAAALGRLGETSDADALRAVAADPARDLHFRREAVLAFARLAPDRLDELPDEPALGLAVAAARYRAAPDDDTKGRLLAAIGTELETDDAARYCAELGIAEARPALEEFLAQEDNEKHPAREVVAAALKRLDGTQ